MRRWRWIDRDAFVLLHVETLAEHGGLPGLRDGQGLEAALARARHLHTYEPDAGCARLAASYAYGIARNHPFVDGNKRASFLAVGLFAGLDGYDLTIDPMEAIATMIALAAGKLSEGELSRWIRKHLVRIR